jgi:hypothetical protein
MSHDTLVIIADGQDNACRIARMQYPLVGSTVLEMSDIADFMMKVTEFALGSQHSGHNGHAKRRFNPIRLLTVIGHGDFDGPYLGIGASDQLTRTEIAMRVRHLQSMRPAFTSDAEVVFGGCDVGQNPWLLADLSVAWGGVDVTAYTTLQTAGMPIFTGDKVTLRGRKLVSAPAELAQQYHDHPDAHWKVPHRR